MEAVTEARLAADRAVTPEVLPAGIEQALVAPVNAFCITLYNERRADFEATLRSLLIATMHFHACDWRMHGFSVVCVVADGIGAVDPEILELLRSRGMLTSQPVEVDEADLHITLHRPAALLRDFAAGEEAGCTEILQRLRLVICLRRCNRGKLQSHCLFFDTLCRQMQPTYCFQIDSGTTLAPDAVLRMVQRMEHDSRMGALAPRVMPEVPSTHDDFLADWQYTNFASRKAMLWPFELAAGHLSVIPGQACIIRWRALHGPNGDGAEDTPNPMSRYLRGITAHRPLERIMFLAEDRVIGNEIVLARDSEWRLGYAPEADAVTDSCSTMRELFRQRRRWNNSALACGLWLLSQWPRILRRVDRNRLRKGAFSISAFVQLLLILREFLLPAQLTGFVAACLSVFYQPASPLGDTVNAALCIALMSWILIECTSARQLAGAVPAWMGIGRRAVVAVTAALFAASVAVSLPWEASSILLAPAVAILPSILVFPPRALAILAPAHVFPVPQLLGASVLSFYSFLNLHDVSWGTKGLTHSSMANTACAAQLKRWRNYIFGGWLACNAVLMAVALNYRGMLAASLNPVVEVFCIAEALIAIVALCYLLLKSPRRLWKVRERS